jgi:hypothetical protein
MKNQPPKVGFFDLAIGESPNPLNGQPVGNEKALSWGCYITGAFTPDTKEFYGEHCLQPR